MKFQIAFLGCRGQHFPLLGHCCCIRQQFLLPLIILMFICSASALTFISKECTLLFNFYKILYFQFFLPDQRAECCFYMFIYNESIEFNKKKKRSVPKIFRPKPMVTLYLQTGCNAIINTGFFMQLALLILGYYMDGGVYNTYLKFM